MGVGVRCWSECMESVWTVTSPGLLQRSRPSAGAASEAVRGRTASAPLSAGTAGRKTSGCRGKGHAGRGGCATAADERARKQSQQQLQREGRREENTEGEEKAEEEAEEEWEERQGRPKRGTGGRPSAEGATEGRGERPTTTTRRRRSRRREQRQRRRRARREGTRDTRQADAAAVLDMADGGARGGREVRPAHPPPVPPSPASAALPTAALSLPCLSAVVPAGLCSVARCCSAAPSPRLSAAPAWAGGGGLYRRGTAQRRAAVGGRTPL